MSQFNATQLEGLLVPQLANAGIDTNSTLIQGVLNTLLPALAALNTSTYLPLLGQVSGLSGPSGINLTAINSTVVTTLLTSLAPVVDQIPLNTTSTLIQIVVAGLASSNSSSSASSNSSSSSGLLQLLVGAVLPGFLAAPSNVTTPLIHDLVGAVALIPRGVGVPFAQKLFLSIGSWLSNANSSSLSSLPINGTQLQAGALSLVPAIISIPENATLAILDNVETAIATLPTNQSVPILQNAGGLISSLTAGSGGNSTSSASSLLESVNSLMFPASGVITNVTQKLIEFSMTMLLLGNNDAASGTGIEKLNVQLKSVMGPHLPEPIVNYAVGTQWNIFGGYPTHKDITPSAILLAVFSIFAILHFVIFAINISRGHKFWLSLGWVFYCVLRIIGWALRIVWSKDATRIKLGIADEVFMVISSIILITSNLILAQRIFTWHHPVGGSLKLFWTGMYGVYFFVFAVIAMTIACQAVPYIYFLSEANYANYKKVSQASSILVCLYSLLAVSLVGLSFLFKATEKDKNALTFQPWWIKSFSTFYFVDKNASQEAEKHFVELNPDQTDPIRIISATHHNYEAKEGLTTERGDTKHNFSLFLIITSSVFLLAGAICRCISFFVDNNDANASGVCKPVVMYIVWGALEAIINILYIVFRVDLRFYRPDKISKKIIEQANAERANHASQPIASTDEEKEQDASL